MSFINKFGIFIDWTNFFYTQLLNKNFKAFMKKYLKYFFLQQLFYIQYMTIIFLLF